MKRISCPVITLVVHHQSPWREGGKRERKGKRRGLLSGEGCGWLPRKVSTHQGCALCVMPLLYSLHICLLVGIAVKYSQIRTFDGCL